MNYRISGFWGRIGAFAIDCLLLCAFGILLGFLFDDLFVLLNTNGLIIGFIICLFYFAIMNSNIGNGQTLGKRILKIKVVDKKGNPLSFMNAFIRSLMLLVPYFFVNYRIPGVSEYSLLYLVKVQLLFLTFIGIIIIYIFNKFSRQSIHDLIVNSIVVDKNQVEYKNEIPPIKPYVFYIYSGFVSLFILLTIYNFYKFRKDLLTDIRIVQNEFLKIDGVLNAIANRNTQTFYFQGKVTVTESLTGVLYVAQNLKNYVEFESSPLVAKAVKIIIEKYPESENLDVINILVVRAFDIGIAKSSRSFRYSKSPYEWVEVLEISNSKVFPKNEDLKKEKKEKVNENLANLKLHKINHKHTIYYNVEMPFKDVKILETAISKLKGYFPVDHVIDIVFLNKEGKYYLKFFINRASWKDKELIKIIKSSANYIKDTGIENEIIVVFVDSYDYAEIEIK